MENGGNVYNNNHINRNSHGNIGWDMFEANTSSRFEWTNCSNAFATGETTSSSNNHSLIFPHQSSYYQQQLSLYGGEGLSHLHPDPHPMCLKLGKRHYFEDTVSVGNREMAIGKRGKPYYSGQVGPSSAAGVGCTVTVPRCQVEGCYVALVNAKDYHRRHKVCEMHSKAPKVIVLGLEQRFCQQCSRFHVVSEFDDAKRSCRRRLAGHNERRRKSAHDSVARNFCQDKFTKTGRALSLLSSKADSWISTSDLSSRSSAALRELIAENRAAQLLLETHLHHNNEMEDLSLSSHHSQPSINNSFIVPNQHHHISPNNWDTGTQVTLNLMHTPTSAFGFLSTRGKNKQVDQECHELWNIWAGNT